MSGFRWFGADARGAAGAAGHERARELAALRVDEPLADADTAFLDGHLAACAPCREIAAQYDAQTSLFAGLRAESLQAPRDLWARTSAALESGAPRRSPGRRARPWRLGSLLAPVTALAAIALLMGSGLLSSVTPAPGGSPTAGLPGATPMAVTAGDVATVSRDRDGTVRIRTGSLAEVCPMGALACGATTELSTATSATFGASADLDAVISPGRDRVVVLDRGEGTGGVYVMTVPVPPASPSPAPSATPDAATAEPSPDPTDPTATPGTPASPITATDPPATADTSPSTSPDPTQTLTPTADPSAAQTATPDPSAPGTNPSPSPSIAVSPAPDGAVEIASGVIVVGNVAAYAPDGLRFAFSARPADGSTGPDVFVWTVGDAVAVPVTTDHASILAGWFGDRLLVSRVADGEPGTVLLDPVTGTSEPAGAVRTWLPAVDPAGRFAAWWDGTVTVGSDGVTPLTGDGNLVLGEWAAGAGLLPDPSASPDSSPEATPAAAAVVLATGPFTDWDAHWSADGTAIAIWTSTGTPGAPGSLALYRVDPVTGAVDLEHALLASAPAYAGFSMGDGRLAWMAPSAAGDPTLQVLAWSDQGVDGRAELHPEQGTRVIR